MVKNKILNIKDLPIRLVASTPCFRKEAGSYGKDTRGMIRQHQFYKVELVSIVENNKCEEELERMTKWFKFEIFDFTRFSNFNITIFIFTNRNFIQW